MNNTSISPTQSPVLRQRSIGEKVEQKQDMRQPAQRPEGYTEKSPRRNLLQGYTVIPRSSNSPYDAESAIRYARSIANRFPIIGRCLQKRDPQSMDCQSQATKPENEQFIVDEAIQKLYRESIRSIEYNRAAKIIFILMAMDGFFKYVFSSQEDVIATQPSNPIALCAVGVLGGSIKGITYAALAVPAAWCAEKLGYKVYSV